MSNQETRDARRKKRQHTTSTRKDREKRGAILRRQVKDNNVEGYYDDDWRSPTRWRGESEDYMPLNFND